MPDANLKTLSMLSGMLDQWEHMRIATDGRVRNLRRFHDDIVLMETPAYLELIEQQGIIAETEKETNKLLERELKRHPIYGPYVKDTPGIGYKGIARLLGTIGDPTWNAADERPRRGPAELWAYCGMHVENGVAPARRKGVRSNWSNAARTRLYVVAEIASLNGASALGDLADATRVKYSDAVHDRSCVRCGPSGKPAQPGSPLSAGHVRARVIRIVGKAILVDLFRVASGLPARYSSPSRRMLV